MASTEQILEALAKLNPEDDAQWTADGLPKMDVLEQLLGDSKVTRADITKAAPTFTRATMVIEDAEGTDEGELDVEPDSENEGQDADSSEAESDIFDEDSDPREAFMAKVENQRAKVCELDTKITELRKQRETEQAKVDSLIEERDRRFPPLTFAQMVIEQNKRNFENAQKQADKLRKQREALAKMGLD